MLFLFLNLRYSSCVDSVGVKVNALSILFESLKVKCLSTESSNFHVSWFISQQFFTESSRGFSDLTLVEWFWLIELLSILGSLLIGMNITFSGPATAIPQSAVHNISRTIIFKCLSWSIDVSFIGNVFVNVDSFFSTEFSAWDS